MRMLRSAWRRFSVHPGNTALMVVTLALGIGASTAVFCVVDSTLLRPAPFANADRLVDILDIRRGGGGGNSLSPQKILGWRQQPAIFEAFEAYAPREVDVAGDGEPERLRTVLVSVGLFPMIDASPQFGRGFVAGDGQPGSAPVVLISDGVWRRRYGGDPEVLGRNMLLNDRPYTIVGVMPRRFRLLSADEALWLPVDLDASRGDTTLFGLWGLGRLRPGVTVAAAQAQVYTIADRLQAETPLPRTWDLKLEQKRVARVNDTARGVLVALLGAVACLLLIAWANVANLFLAQAMSREREMAIRSSLGASRRAMVAEVLIDSLVLSLAAGALGLVFASWAVTAIVAAAPENLVFMPTSSIEIDGRVLLMSVGVTLVAGMMFSVIPAARGFRPGLETLLRGIGYGSPQRLGRIPGALVVVEVAFSLVVLAGAALMIRTVVRLQAIDPGFQADGHVAMHVDLPSDRYATEATRRQFFDALAERLAAHPGITGMTYALSDPGGNGIISFAHLEADGPGRTAEAAETFLTANQVDSRYFSVVGLAVLAGRTFAKSEPSADDVVVSKALAARLFPNEVAIGRRFRLGAESRWLQIIGVVGDVSGIASGESTANMRIYYLFSDRPAPAAPRATAPTPFPRRTYSNRVLMVRAADPLGSVDTIRASVWALDAQQPVTRVALVSDLFRSAFARQRFVLILMSAFGLIALVLTSAGILAILSQVVAQRTREIGVRVALGATAGNVRRLIVGRGMALAAIGMGIGLGGATVLTRVLAGLLYDVAPLDPLSFAGAVAGLALAALVACWLPTRRALRIQPAEALRE